MEELNSFQGETLRKRRERLGYTVRDLARMAGVSKTTIVKLEHGGQPIKRVREALSKVFGVAPDQMARTGQLQEGLYVISRYSDGSWRPFHASLPAVPIDLDRIQHEDERLRLGRLGFVSRFERYGGHGLGSSRVTNGALMEIWRRTETDYSHPGHEVCTVLRGAVRVFVEQEVFELYEGDSATFVSSEPHNYEPIKPLGPKDLPPLVMYIKVHPDPIAHTRHVEKHV